MDKNGVEEIFMTRVTELYENEQAKPGKDGFENTERLLLSNIAKLDHYLPAIQDFCSYGDGGQSQSIS